jgi:hypothetical protein
MEKRRFLAPASHRFNVVIPAPTYHEKGAESGSISVPNREIFMLRKQYFVADA